MVESMLDVILGRWWRLAIGGVSRALPMVHRAATHVDGSYDHWQSRRQRCGESYEVRAQHMAKGPSSRAYLISRPPHPYHPHPGRPTSLDASRKRPVVEALRCRCSSCLYDADAELFHPFPGRRLRDRHPVAQTFPCPLTVSTVTCRRYETPPEKERKTCRHPVSSWQT